MTEGLKEEMFAWATVEADEWTKGKTEQHLSIDASLGLVPTHPAQSVHFAPCLQVHLVCRDAFPVQVSGCRL